MRPASLLPSPYGSSISGLGLQISGLGLQSWGTKAEGLFCHSNFVYTRFHGTEPFYDLFLASWKAGEQKQKVCLSIQTSFTLVFMEQNHSLGHLSCISSAVASGSALKVPRAEALHFLA